MRRIETNLSLYRQGSLVVILLLSVVELCLFFSIPNILGCAVTIGSVMLFNRFVLQYNILTRHPLSSLSLFLLYCFMIMPLPATLIDGHEISYKMEVPEVTFILQFFFLLVVILSFYTATRNKRGESVKEIIKTVGLFETPSSFHLWVMGLVGIIAHILIRFFENFGAGNLNIIAMLMYAPICILFGPLLGLKKCSKSNRILVWLYIFLMSVAMISTNSRSMFLSFLATWALVSAISFLYTRSRFSLSKVKVVALLVVFFVVLGPLKDMATAMVVVRSQRSNISMEKLFEMTMNVYNNKEQLYYLQKQASMKYENEKTTINDWGEYYVSNIFLQRICNYRVIDASIYHALKVGIPNDKVFDDFLIRLKIMYPTPIVHILFGDIDKKDYMYSPMDYLYTLSTKRNYYGRNIIGGDVGLGLATFGVLYFVLVFFVYFILFVLFDSMFYRKRGRIIFSFVPFVCVFPLIIRTFQMASGIVNHISLILYSFPIMLFLYAIIFSVVKVIFPTSYQTNEIKIHR